jgi:hypothetical protein
MVVASPNRIRIDFQAIADNSVFGVEKEDGGRKRRWLRGVTSGIAKDGHGERMTEKCIKSFEDQARSGDILLYAGKHDFNFVDDIGRLSEFEVGKEMDWMTGYRLYDEGDGFDALSKTLQDADKVWRQSCGIQPYTKPAPRGFSIEGDIPEGGILYMDSLGRRVIDEVKLAGVVLVRNPAYRTSVAQAVFKALGIPTTNEIRKELMGGLADAIDRKQEERDYYDEYYQITGALEDMTRAVMRGPDPDKRDRLEGIFREYAALMIELVTRHPEVFADDEAEGEDGAAGPPAHIYEAKTGQQQALLVKLVEAEDQLRELVNRYAAERQPGGKADAEKQSEGPHGAAE